STERDPLARLCTNEPHGAVTAMLLQRPCRRGAGAHAILRAAWSGRRHVLADGLTCAGPPETNRGTGEQTCHSPIRNGRSLPRFFASGHCAVVTSSSRAAPAPTTTSTPGPRRCPAAVSS